MTVRGKLGAGVVLPPSPGVRVPEAQWNPALALGADIPLGLHSDQGRPDGGYLRGSHTQHLRPRPSLRGWSDLGLARRHALRPHLFLIHSGDPAWPLGSSWPVGHFCLHRSRLFLLLYLCPLLSNVFLAYFYRVCFSLCYHSFMGDKK